MVFLIRHGAYFICNNGTCFGVILVVPQYYCLMHLCQELQEVNDPFLYIDTRKNKKIGLEFFFSVIMILVHGSMYTIINVYNTRYFQKS